MNILQFLSASDVTVWLEDMCGNVFRLFDDDGFPFRECVENVMNCFFWARGSPYFKRSSIEFSAES